MALFYGYKRLTKPADWSGLAGDDKWVPGRSAFELAHAWQTAKGIPPEIESTFDRSGIEALRGLEVSLCLAEKPVFLDTHHAPSMTDLMVYGCNAKNERVVVAVEGKADEPFASRISTWIRGDAKNSNGSGEVRSSRRRRLDFLATHLGVHIDSESTLRYQLLHRTASAVLEAQLYGATIAAVIVHQFGPECAENWDDFVAFLKTLGAPDPTKGEVCGPIGLGEKRALPVYFMWWHESSSIDKLQARETRGDPTQRATESNKPLASHRARLPAVVAHADWSVNAKKRWLTIARLSGTHYDVSAPELVGEASTLIERLCRDADGAGAVVGFDFPIGLPASYASLAGIKSFREALPQFGTKPWDLFYQVAEKPIDISLYRPFYPHGNGKHRDLTDALGFEAMSELLRKCELKGPGINDACPLFWTLGAKQVGRGAITGWVELLTPGLQQKRCDVALWPFDGPFEDLLRERECVVVETYPAEACLHVGLTAPGNRWSKRIQDDRKKQAVELLACAEKRTVAITGQLRAEMLDGFGFGSDGEDRFDSVVGVFSMLEVILGYRPDGAPDDSLIREVEGWIFGKTAAASTQAS